MNYWQYFILTFFSIVIISLLIYIIKGIIAKSRKTKNDYAKELWKNLLLLGVCVALLIDRVLMWLNM